METKIAIQGIKGSFHHQVAQEYFDHEYDLDECMSFTSLVKSLMENKSQKGIMALENSIAGSIIPNYALIDRNNLHIIGEHYLDIHMNLMALKGQKIEDITEVHSHPMALLQCADFFLQYPNIKLVESGDTAESARRIHDQKIAGVAAIASPIAAKMYDLEILSAGIHTIQSNKTRFVIVKTQNKELPKEEINKASIKFELDDTPGSLATILNVMNNSKLNLTKIQSMPIIETPFQYSFFVDVIFEKYKHFEKAKKILELMTTHFKVLGEYKRGIQ
ncbi:prephenate dehydratase [Flavobacterium paronense]|uniref:prephenate dehydratase n=1 Tax=Flavobacterium paronense TaxID=1392775 RepID=A0ABV5GDL0_9FLAO|nr:prephenate dehydratase [Flavobacterium paronense]MDN3678028.1 prephenate dehydratase [Flavobacterium paronense]